MRFSRRVVIIVCTLVLILALGSHPAQAMSNSSPNFAVIDAYVEAEMRADRVPGVALAIVHDDQIVHMRGFGDDGTGKPVTPQTAFILGSMSKSFTALAVMQLVEQGKVALDTPVQHYLPWFRVADPDASALITVRHLLLHTSGIPTKAPHATAEPLTIAAHARALATVALNHKPGHIHEYASPNYLVLGAIIEQVTGQSYADYVQHNIFAPLAMRHTFTSQTLAMSSTMARGHRYWFGVPRPAVLRYEADRLPTAALISSAEDLAQVLIAQLNQGKYNGQAVLSASSITEMHRAAIQSEGFSYAMGWRVSQMHGVTAVHHGGVVPHFRGKMVLLPNQAWGVIVLTNVSSVLPIPLTSHRIADNIAGSLVGTPLPIEGSPLTRIYLGITAGIALLTLSQIHDMVALRRWRTHLTKKRPRSIAMGLLIELLIPIVVLLGLPYALQLPWSEVLRSTPDIGYWTIGSAFVGLATGLWKTVIAYRVVWRQRTQIAARDSIMPTATG